MEEGRGLAAYFLQSMEKDQLFDILDARVLNEGKREEILVIAELASRCLHLNGRRRPTMKEVAAELEEIKMMKADSSSVQHQDDKIEWNAADIEYYDDFSSISGSMHFDTITPTLPTSHPLLAQP